MTKSAQRRETYYGGKGQKAVYQTLINQIPPHTTYIAPFAGMDAVAWEKLPAERTVLVDLDLETLKKWAGSTLPNLELYNCCGIEWLKHEFGLDRWYRDGESSEWDRAGQLGGRAWDTFVLFDPPYPAETLTSESKYRHNLVESQHLELLDVAKRLPCNVMVCSYWSDVYASALSGWRSLRYYSVTRRGERREEWLWMNYAAPAELHDSRFVGDGKREKERIRRRCKTWSEGLQRMEPLERQAVMDAITGRTIY